MKTTQFIPTLALAAVLLAGCETTSSTPAIPAYDAKDGRVTVNYTQPEKFTDARDSYLEGTSNYVLTELNSYLQGEVRRYLPPGEKFTVTFTDIDRAGDFAPPMRGGLGQVRVIKSVYPPRFDLSYTLTGADGKVIAQGTEQLTDLSFHMSSSFDIKTDPLYYEKNLLKKWVKSMFQP